MAHHWEINLKALSVNRNYWTRSYRFNYQYRNHPIKEFPTMTLIESIYEIKSAVLALQRYASSKDEFVSKRAQIKYVELLDRFFSENENFVKPQQRQSCLHDPGYFLSLIDEAIEKYYLEVEA